MATKGNTFKNAASQQTTDATPVNVAAITLGDAASFLAIARVVFRRASNGDSGSYYLRQGVKRHGGGAATLVGAIAKDTFEDAGAASCDAIFTVNSNDIRVQLTGIAATIDWSVFVEIWEYTP